MDTENPAVDDEAEPTLGIAAAYALAKEEGLVRVMIFIGLAFIALLLLAALITFAVLAQPAHAEAPTGAVCPPGNVKYEADGGYEYTDNSATVALADDDRTATWTPAPDRTVIAVCIKIGGPGGGSLVNPDPAAGSWTSEKYAVSHVVLTAGGPNAVEITGLTAERTVAGITTDPPSDYRALVILLVLLAAILIGIETLGALRRRRWGK